MERTEKKRFTKKNIIVLITAGVLALALVATAIILLLQPKKFDTELPVAEIRLSNGKKLYFELDYVNSSNAVNNFIFLAQEGFFNDTVIFDNQSKYVKFGGYESISPLKHRAASTTAAPKTSLESTSIKTKYGYAVSDDSSAAVVASSFGALSTIKYSTSSLSARTEFQICGNNDITNNESKVQDKASGKTITIGSKGFGRAFGADTLEYLEVLAGMSAKTFQGSADYYVWRPLEQTIKIKKVIIHYKHVKDAIWGDWDFYEVMEGRLSSYSYPAGYDIPK